MASQLRRQRRQTRIIVGGWSFLFWAKKHIIWAKKFVFCSLGGGNPQIIGPEPLK
jgi:hypothetical protein